MKLPHTLFVLLLFVASLNAQSLERGPYLQSGGTTSIIIKWRTDTPTTSKVWIGTQLGSLNTIYTVETNSFVDHEVFVNNLNPDTKYYYAVGYEEIKLAGGDSDHFFITAPTVGAQHPIRAWVLGDCGTRGSGQTAVRDAFYEYNNEEELDMILLLGDNAYSDGTDDEYQGAIFEMYAEVVPQIPMWSCMGNHDYRSADIENESGPYFDIFTFPENGELGGVPSGLEAYYSFDYANVHFIVLDSEASDKDPGDPQLVWLENDLNSTNQDWIIVMFHHPPYSKGSHDSDEGGALIEMRENVLPILDAAGVDLVLSGHSHSYERSYLLNGHYGASDELEPEMILDDGDGQIEGSGAYQKTALGVEANKGAVYIVSGSAAKVSSADLDHPVMYYSKKELGSVLLEIEGDQLDVEFINDDGDITDHFTMIKTGLSEGVPPTVSIVDPIANQTFLENEVISITANATDSDGTITKVEFFIDNNYLMTDYSVPYVIDWTAIGIGAYSLTAVATDNDGNTTTSTPVNVSVNADEPEAPGISVSNCPTNITLPCVDGAGANASWSLPVFESDCTPEQIPNCELPIDIAETTYLGTFDGSHFYQTNDPMKWTLAKIFAESIGGNLATINSIEENNFIEELISDNSWIGYNDELIEGQFEWVSGAANTFENWGEFQPSGSSGSSDDYTLFSASNGTWNDKGDYKNLAIIEIPCPTIGGGDSGLQITQTGGFVNGALFPEGTTTVSYQASDACGNTASCIFEVTVNSCAPPCSITATATNVQCSDNGTPTDASDDTYSFDLMVNGESAGTGWTANGLTGVYGQLLNQGPFNEPSGTNVSWDIAAIGNPDCTTNINFVVPSCAVDPAPCDPIQIEDFNWMLSAENAMYYLSDDKETWEDAAAICESLGGHLVHINSQAENDLLFAELTDFNNYVLIGMSDHLEEGTVLWSDGSALTYDNTESNSDNSNSKDFGLMNSWTGTWNFVNKYVQKKFILEIPCGTPIEGIQNLRNTRVATSADLHHDLAELQESELSNTIQLFPNPVRDVLNLHFVGHKEKSNVLLKIISMDNKQLLTQSYSIKKGMNALEVPTSQLFSGSYFLQLIMDDKVIVERFVK